ncbi:hypothetical protein ACVWW1_000631 [Bradyrhizobium sp. JR3.5]
MGRAQLGVEERQQRVDLGADLGVLVEAIGGRQRKQHEGMAVSVAQRVMHAAVRRQAEDEARPAIRRLGLGQQVVQPFQRDRAALGIPAHLGRLGVAIDLARLHKQAARRGVVGCPILMQPVDKAAARSVPADRRPQRQGVVDDAVLQPRDDVGGPVRRNALCLSHRAPWNRPNVSGHRLIARADRHATCANPLKDLP